MPVGPRVLVPFIILVEAISAREVIVENLIGVQLRELVFTFQFPCIDDLFLQDILAIVRDLIIESVRSTGHEVGSGLLEQVPVLIDAFHIFLRLLILEVVPAEPISILSVLTLSLQPAPVSLDNEGGMLLLFLQDIVDVSCVQVLNEVVLSAH